LTKLSVNFQMGNCSGCDDIN